MVGQQMIAGPGAVRPNHAGKDGRQSRIKGELGLWSYPDMRLADQVGVGDGDGPLKPLFFALCGRGYGDVVQQQGTVVGVFQHRHAGELAAIRQHPGLPVFDALIVIVHHGARWLAQACHVMTIGGLDETASGVGRASRTHHVTGPCMMPSSAILPRQLLGTGEPILWLYTPGLPSIGVVPGFAGYRSEQSAACRRLCRFVKRLDTVGEVEIARLFTVSTVAERPAFPRWGGSLLLPDRRSSRLSDLANSIRLFDKVVWPAPGNGGHLTFVWRTGTSLPDQPPLAWAFTLPPLLPSTAQESQLSA